MRNWRINWLTLAYLTTKAGEETQGRDNRDVSVKRVNQLAIRYSWCCS